MDILQRVRAKEEKEYQDQVAGETYQKAKNSLYDSIKKSDEPFDLLILEASEEIGCYMQSELKKGQKISAKLFAESLEKMEKYSNNSDNQDAVSHAGSAGIARALISTWAHGEEFYNAIMPKDRKLTYEGFISGMKKYYPSDTAPKTMAPQTKTR